MKTLRSMLNLGTNALGTHRATLSVLSKNIANASTPGYSRERLSIESMSFGLGAQVTGLTSLRDTTYQKALLGASQELGFGQGKASVLEIAEPFVNDLDGAGMGPALDALFGALQSAGANPADLNERGAVLDRARELADQIRNSATGLESARRSAEKSAAATVTEVNELAAQLARLNGQIRDIQGSGDPALELVDQRDELLAALGELVDVEVTTQGSDVNVALAGGQPVVSGDTASTLSLSGGGSGPLTLSVARDNGLPLAGPKSLGGKLGGLLEARDGTLRSALDALDATAEGLAGAMNALHTSGFGLDGATGRNLFDITPGTGAASSLKLSADISGKPEFLAFAADGNLLPGDNHIAQQLLAVRDLKLPNGKTPDGGLDEVTSTIASALQAANGSAEGAASRLADFEGLRASRSGVSIQEEMVALTEAQRAFEAASRILKTADELYETVLQMV